MRSVTSPPAPSSTVTLKLSCVAAVAWLPSWTYFRPEIWLTEKVEPTDSSLPLSVSVPLAGSAATLTMTCAAELSASVRPSSVWVNPCPATTGPVGAEKPTCPPSATVRIPAPFGKAGGLTTGASLSGDTANGMTRFAMVSPSLTATATWKSGLAVVLTELRSADGRKAPPLTAAETSAASPWKLTTPVPLPVISDRPVVAPRVTVPLVAVSVTVRKSPSASPMVICSPAVDPSTRAASSAVVRSVPRRQGVGDGWGIEL